MEKILSGFADRYIIRSDGTIVDTLTNSVVKPIPSSTLQGRYAKVSLQLPNTHLHKLFLVHHLIAETFIPNPSNKVTVRHLDGDTQNNAVDNLAWSSYSETSHHAYEKTRGTRTHKSTSVTEDAKELVLSVIREYENIELSIARISELGQLPYSTVRYSLVSLIDEGRLIRNTLCTLGPKYSRYSYTVPDP